MKLTLLVLGSTLILAVAAIVCTVIVVRQQQHAQMCHELTIRMKGDGALANPDRLLYNAECMA